MVLWVALGIVLVFDSITLRGSYSIINQARNTPVDLPISKSVRINFDAYTQAANRISAAPTYQPDPVTTPNPFQSPPKKESKK